jgi:hypothetical protein
VSNFNSKYGDIRKYYLKHDVAGHMRYYIVVHHNIIEPYKVILTLTFSTNYQNSYNNY